MTTTNERPKDELKPRLLVPVGESIIVHYSGKPPKPSVREYQGQRIWEVAFWLGIADKNYPDVLFQYHPVIVRAWISPQRTVEAKGETKPIQASKLYKMLQTIAGQETADKFAHHDASITEAEIKGETDEEKRKWLQDRYIPADWWKPLRGFYVAIFKEPRKDKETQEIVLAENCGIFWQEINELKPLKVARIMNEEQLQANITWPPPKPELGKPAPTNNAAAGSQPQAPPKEETTPEPPPFTRKFGTRAEQTEELKTLCKAHPDFGKLKGAFLLVKGAELVSNLPDEDVKHLLVLFWLEERRMNGGVPSASINTELMRRHKDLHQLAPAEAIFLLAAADFEAAQDDKF